MTHIHIGTRTAVARVNVPATMATITANVVGILGANRGVSDRAARARATIGWCSSSASATLPFCLSRRTFRSSGRARAGVRCGFLNISERGAGVEGGGGERVTQRVPSDLLPMPMPMPARPAARRTLRSAQRRSIRCPSVRRKIGPPRRAPITRSMVRAVRRASAMVTILPPLRRTVRCGARIRAHARRCRRRALRRSVAR